MESAIQVRGQLTRRGHLTRYQEKLLNRNVSLKQETKFAVSLHENIDGGAMIYVLNKCIKFLSCIIRCMRA